MRPAAAHAYTLRGSAAVVASAAILAGVVAGCDGDTDDRLPTNPPPVQTAAQEPTPGVELSAEEQQAVDEVLALFGEFMDAYVAAATARPLTEEAIDAAREGYLRSPLLDEVTRELLENHNDGVAFDGDLGWSFFDVEHIDLDHMVQDTNLPEMLVRVCIDATGWVPVDKQTGQPVGEPGDRHTATVEAAWSDDWRGDGRGVSGWRLFERNDDKSQQC